MKKSLTYAGQYGRSAVILLNKFVVVLLVCIVCISAAINDAIAASSFNDVPDSHWAQGSIENAVQKGYVNGYTDGTFRPNREVTHAEFVKMIVEALKLPVDLDAAQQNWYDPYIAAAKKAGIYKDDFDAASWNKPITRMDMATIAVRASKSATYSKANVTAEEYMYVATSVGLIQGKGNGNVAPLGKTTRAESITVIERVLKKLDGGELQSADNHTRSNAEIAWHKTNMYTMLGHNLDFNRVTRSWRADDLTLETRDGLYKSEILNFYVIDYADKKDPFRSKVKNLDSMEWMFSKYDGTYPISEYPDSYIFVFETKIHYNKDTKKYADTHYQPINFSGISMTDVDKYLKGDLNGVGKIYEKNGDHPKQSLYIVPKYRFDEADQFEITLYTLNYTSAPYLSKRMFLSRTFN